MFEFREKAQKPKKKNAKIKEMSEEKDFSSQTKVRIIEKLYDLKSFGESNQFNSECSNAFINFKSEID